jgi:hypothetical protein
MERESKGGKQREREESLWKWLERERVKGNEEREREESL